MKSKLKGGAILALLVLAAVAVRPVHAAPPAGYTLVWDDEYNSTTPSVTYPSGDTHETLGSPPDPAFWSYDTGNNGGWGNNEVETYTTTNASIVSDSNAANGTALDINAALSGGNWTSARINTSNSSVIGTQPLNGYFESQIEAPVGSGLWPKWWMMGVDYNTVGWPACTEQDLFGQFGVNPTNEFTDEQYGTTDDEFSNGNSVTITAGQYNIYGYLWTPTVQTSYLNGTAYSTLANAGFGMPSFFLYDLAVGGAASPGGGIGANTGTSADFKVGYTRVYQATGSVQTASNAADATPPVVAGTGTAPIAPGNYQLVPEVAPQERLDAPGGNTSVGTGIDIAESNGSATQAWTFSTTGVTPVGDYIINIYRGGIPIGAEGWYQVYVDGFPEGYIYASFFSAFTGSSLQSFNVVASNPGYYQIRSANSNTECLYVPQGGGDLAFQNCDTTANDEWQILPLTPTAPTLTATASAGGVAPVILNWTASAGALVYRVYRSTTSGGEANPALAGGIATTSYTDTSTLVKGATYYYKVTAVSAGGASPFSNEASVTLAPAAPAGPTGLTATASAGGLNPVSLAWTASVGATGYQVFRGTVQIGTTGASPTTFSDASAATGIANSYTVKAVNAGGTSAASNTASVTLAPAAPTGLTATAILNGISLSWNASAGAIVYRVYRSTTAGGEGNPALIGGLGAPGYTDTAIVTGDTYYYKVTAVNSVGASAFSTEASATAGSNAPSAPTGLTATASAGGVGPITLSWNASNGAFVYRVYRSTTSNGEVNPALAGGLVATAYTDTSTLTAGITYYYKVTAANANGASVLSSEAGALLRPAPPTNVTSTATAGAAPVTLNWTASVGATGYTVYRGTVSLGSTATATFSDTTVVAAGVSVSYTVTATNAAGTSAASAAGSVLLRPAAPAGLTATGGNNEVALAWSASPGATVYRVYRSTTSGGEANPALVGGLGSPAYTDTAAVNGTTYYYTVTAVSTAGASGFSTEASATPANTAPPPVTTLTATAAVNGVGPVKLAWSASLGATVYRVFRSTISGGEGNPALAGGITTTAYTDTGVLTPGITYYYKATAVSAGGASLLSAANEAGVLLSPAAATGLTATAAAGGNAPVTLAWTASVGATGYNVYRGTVNIGSTGTTGFSDTSVVPGGVVVSYTVTAVNSAGTSPASAAANVTLRPAAATNLQATAGVNEIFLSWNASPGTTVYRVYRSTTSGGETNPALAGGIGTTSYTDTAAPNGVTFYYEVTAVNTVGVSGFSNEATAAAGTTPPPTNLVASTSANGAAPINLTWTAANGALTYRVYRSTASNGEGNPALVSGLASTSYSDATASAGSTYYYKVTAVNNIAASAFSNEASATPAPAPPTVLTATAGANEAILNWNASTGATSYGIYRGNGPGFETLLSTSATPTFTDTTATGAFTYYYKVNAVGVGGTSGYSNEVHLQLDPATPSGLATSPGNGQVVVSWNISNGTSYNVYRSTTSGGEGAIPYQNISGTTFTDAGLTNGTTYYYTVATVNAVGTSAQTNEVSGTPNDYTAIASGGAGVGVWMADTDFVGGTPASTANVITTIGLVNPAPEVVYQYNRFGSCNYTIPGLIAGDSYEVRLHFAETYWTGPGQREFNVLINGTQVLTNFDIYANAGGQNKGNIQQFLANADGSGQITIQFTTVVDNAQINGIELYLNNGPIIPNTPTGLAGIPANSQITLGWSASTGATGYNIYRSTVSGNEGGAPYATAATTAYTDTGLVNGTVYYYQVAAVNAAGTSAQSAEANATPSATAGNTSVQIMCGGDTPAPSPWLANTDFVGGGTGSSHTGNVIDTSAVVNPAPQRIYQGNHNGSFTYTIPAENPGESYTVRLHFAELFFNAAGSREFNVFINGTQVLTNFDIWANAGAEFKANIQQFTAIANGSGQIVIQFVTVINNGQLNGLEVIPATPTAPTGLTATAGTNQITLNWNAQLSAGTYNVYRSLTPGGEGVTPYQTLLPSATFTDTGLTTGTTYYYTVTAVNSGGESPQSIEASATSN